MIPNIVKRVTKKMFRSVGLEVHRVGNPPAPPVLADPPTDTRTSLQGLLEQARKAGLSPAAVIDVGAAHGNFSQCCHAVFSATQYVLVEALEEFRPHLEAAVRSLPNAHLVFAAAAPKPGEITINVHPDLWGSSLYLEEEDSDVNGVPRSVRAVTLDGLVADTGVQGPFLLKIDVQGAELDVLAGAEEVLRQTDYVLMEVSLFEFFKGGPLLHDVVAYMKQRGFVPYDVTELHYRILDDALSQLDIAFVKEHGALRKYQHYATREQREERNKWFNPAYAAGTGASR